MKKWLHEYSRSFSYVGLVVATLLFAGSVSPSLLPRPPVVQGILSGFVLAIGYGIGVLLVLTWRFLQLPIVSNKTKLWGKRVSTVMVGIIAFYFVWSTSDWQNSIRERMDMPPVESAYPITFFTIAILWAWGLVLLARFLLRCNRYLSAKLRRFVPRRIATGISTFIVFLVTIFVANGVVTDGALNLADNFFLQADQMIDEGIERPERSLVCGSPDSLVPWDMIGRKGKTFIAGGPTAESIKAVTGEASLEPVRVYVGMETIEDEASQAKLALQELIRVGGFDRSILIVATPTGTGWLDPGAVDTVEYLHNGDTATVSIQYSYLPSWITILIDPDRSKRSARALFTTIYDYWKDLPKSDRPKLYLQGLSLGSLGSEDAADLLTIFEDPIHGAVWSGPPFPSQQWKKIVRDRNAGTPEWMPTYREQRIIRFTAQENHLQIEQPWGAMRNVYIQYASDPMVWFSHDLAWRPPAWLQEPRGPDVSPQLQWYPLVTYLQVAFDLAISTSVPVGHGHNYSPASYIDAWIGVTDPAGWTPEKIALLKETIVPPIDPDP